ncbi:MAG: hypothetical protein MZU91_14905 [Desulfosudis oleivorans]|nr:hypothetical protein [Desulfosudis oleivorans]
MPTGAAGTCWMCWRCWRVTKSAAAYAGGRLALHRKRPDRQPPHEGADAAARAAGDGSGRS